MAVVLARRKLGLVESLRQRGVTASVEQLPDFRVRTPLQAALMILKRHLDNMFAHEADLKPMILKDIEERTGLDKSTISRVSNMKYAQTKWGTFPLKFFFTDSYTTEDGEEMSTRKITLTLKELIEHEDKKKPLSDDALSKVLKEKGFPVARRTVAKYREQLGIPVARLRK